MDHIKEHWDKNSLKYKDSYEASWGDYYAINLEIDAIGEYIKDGFRVLDVGCANGYSTIKQWQKHKLTSITGIDFSENMILQANSRKRELQLDDRVVFEEGDIRQLAFEDSTFDAVYTTRVVINLTNWDQQKEAINECLRVTKSGGVVIFSEAFWEPLVLLNSLRAIVNLDSLVEHDFNRYLKRKKFESYLESKNLNYTNNDFSSIYYLGSRFLRELVTNPSDYPGYNNPINDIFFEIEKNFSGGGFGIQQIYLIQK